MEWFTFDDAYVQRLLAGDRDTNEHFDRYFRDLLRAKARRHVPPDEVDDAVQETLTRVNQRLKEVREPAKLGAFVLSVANWVMHEQWRNIKRSQRTDAEIKPQEPEPEEERLIREERRRAVLATLEQLPRRDAEVLRLVFLEEVDKDEICRRLEIDRDYLRVLLHRASEKFRKFFPDL